MDIPTTKGEEGREQNGAVNESDPAAVSSVFLNFASQVDATLEGRLPANTQVMVSSTTPLALRLIGLRNLPMLITPRHIISANSEEDDRQHTHGLSVDQIKDLPSYLSEPAILLESGGLENTDRVIVVSDRFDNKDRPIIVVIQPDGKGKFNSVRIDANFINTLYGKNSFNTFLQSAILEKRVLFWDKEKTQGIYRGLQLQLPQGLYNLESNTIIRKAKKFVNSPEQENSGNSENSKDDEDHARALPGELKESTKKKEEEKMDIPMTDEERIVAEARERARQLAAQTGEPHVTIEWSESADFNSGDVLSLTEADKKLAALDSNFTRDGYYDKVKLHIDYIKDGNASSYEGCRFDIGTERQGLVGHIQSYWDFYLNNPMRFHLNSKGNASASSGPTESDYAYMANDLAPFFKYHRDLSDMITKAEEMGMAAEEVDKVRAFVRQCRMEVNGVEQAATVTEEEEHRDNEIESVVGKTEEETPTAQPISYRDRVSKIRDEMAQTMLDYIEQNPQDWQKGWNNLTSPINGKTNTSYRGFNALYLALVGMSRGYDDPRWVTFNQAKDLGASIKRGEKSSPVLFFEFYDRLTKKAYDSRTTKDMTDEDRAAYEKENVYAVLKYSSVFNASQCVNFPERDLESLKMSEEDRANQNELIETIIANSAASVNYDGGNRAFYRPSTDSIHLPAIEAFNSMQDYYATALHEIAHSTGHASRLHRDLTGDHGSPNYAIEELRAELACVYMQIEQGIQLDGKHIENHAAYLSSWLGAVKNDKSIFFKAASDAQKIADYVSAHYVQSVQVDELELEDENEAQSSVEDSPTAEYLRTEQDKRDQEQQNALESRLNANVREWYQSAFPTDKLGAELDGGLTFKDVLAALSKGDNIYDVLGAYDSVVRERLFWYLAEIQDKSYEEIYDAWMNADTQQEGEHKEKEQQEFEASANALAAKEAGLPFSSTPFGGDEDDFNPYVFDGSMSVEDYKKMWKHIDEHREENEYRALKIVLNNVRNGEPLAENITFEDFDGADYLINVGDLILKYGGEELDGSYVITDEVEEKYAELQSKYENEEHKEKNPLEENVKQWYTTTFPNDNVGASLDEYITFVDINESVFNPTEQNANIYEVLGGSATTEVRDRVFSRLAEIKGVAYDDIFKAWAQFDYNAQIAKQTNESIRNASFYRETKNGSPVNGIKEIGSHYYVAIINNYEQKEVVFPDGYPAGYLIATDYNPNSGEFTTAAYGFETYEEARKHYLEYNNVDIGPSSEAELYDSKRAEQLKAEQEKLINDAAFGYSLENPQLKFQDCLDAVREMNAEAVREYAEEYRAYLDSSSEFMNDESGRTNYNFSASDLIKAWRENATEQGEHKEEEQTPENIEAAEEQAVSQENSIYYPINEEAAKRAKEANSYSDYVEGSATALYRQSVDKAVELAMRQKEHVDPMHHQQIDALVKTYARKLAENLNARYVIEARMPSYLITGGGNFQVGKKMKQNAARDKNDREWQEIQGLLDKIRSTGRGGISSDDPNSIQKLEAKLANLEKSQETMKAVNAYYRMHKTLEGCPHLTKEQLAELRADIRRFPHLEGKPYASWQLSNNNAEMHRIRSRIQELKNKQEVGFVGWVFDGGEVQANVEANRLQIVFDERPDDATRSELKSNGFRWSPTNSAWQRQLNRNAYYAADRISTIQPIDGSKPSDLQRAHVKRQMRALNVADSGEHKEKITLEDEYKQAVREDFPKDFIDDEPEDMSQTSQNTINTFCTDFGGEYTYFVANNGLSIDDICTAYAEHPYDGFGYQFGTPIKAELYEKIQNEGKGFNIDFLDDINAFTITQNGKVIDSGYLYEDLVLKYQERENKPVEAQERKREWLSIELPEGSLGKQYGANSMVKMPTGEYSYYSLFIPTKFIKTVNGKQQMRVASDFTYRLNNDGRQVELTGQELRDSFAGMPIGKQYKRVAPSRAYAKVFADLEKNVPAEMKALPNWCVYRTWQREDKDKKGKVLKSAVTGAGASSKNPGDWTDFNTAMKYAKENGFAGVSFLLEAKNGITCIDLDECVLNAETGEMKERATKLIDSLKGTYMERSTSGNGVHIFVKDDILRGGKYRSTAVDAQKGDLEVFDNQRVISMTGNMFSETNTLTRAGSAATVYLRKELGENKQRAAVADSHPRPSSGMHLSDSELVRWIRSSKKASDFDALYSGKGLSGDKSVDDAKLAQMLLYFNGGDEEQTFRIMRESALYRADKPDSYYHHTIKKINGGLEKYAKLPSSFAADGVGKVGGRRSGGGNNNRGTQA